MNANVPFAVVMSVSFIVEKSSWGGTAQSRIDECSHLKVYIESLGCMLVAAILANV